MILGTSNHTNFKEIVQPHAKGDKLIYAKDDTVLLDVAFGEIGQHNGYYHHPDTGAPLASYGWEDTEFTILNVFHESSLNGLVRQIKNWSRHEDMFEQTVLNYTETKEFDDEFGG